jgi:hypothetical protein
VSTQGLTYPHDFVLSRMRVHLLRRIIHKTGNARKLLIFLETRRCRESGQAGAKQDRTRLSARARAVTHKVFHRLGGELQKGRQIMNLRLERELRLKIFQNAPSACNERG